MFCSTRKMIHCCSIGSTLSLVISIMCFVRLLYGVFIKDNINHLSQWFNMFFSLLIFSFILCVVRLVVALIGHYRKTEEGIMMKKNQEKIMIKPTIDTQSDIMVIIDPKDESLQMFIEKGYTVISKSENSVKLLKPKEKIK